VTAPQQHFYESQRLRLSYWTWGDPSRPIVLMQHGGRDPARSWDRLAEALTDEYFVVAPDLRGHGDSQWAIGGEYSTGQNVVDLVALLEVLGAGTPRPVRAVAHSFGGLVVCLAAAAFPEYFAAIGSIEGRWGLGEEPERWTAERWRQAVLARRDLEGREPRTYASVEEATERMVEANRRLEPGFAHHLAEHAVQPIEAPGGGYQWKFDNWARAGVRLEEITIGESREVFGAIQCRVLMFVGEDSGGRWGMQREVKHFQRGRALLVPGAAHWVHYEQPELVERELRAFFASV
jgi:pimeloyl-ACP methyl ester carboxylesterase